MGLYFPVFSVAGPYAAIALWLWLGVLDSIQGIAIGVLLLQTLSRVHVTATLAIAQILGSITVAIGRSKPRHLPAYLVRACLQQYADLIELAPQLI